MSSSKTSGSAALGCSVLPPYSPELNPIERVWKLTRRNCLHNRYFAQLEEVIEAVEGQFFKWKRPNAILRRLCSLV
jgi:transposase